MIEINYDENMLAQVERKLGQMKSEAPKALKNAINQTAKQARKDLAIEAQKTYTVKTGRFNKAMKIKNATPTRLEATIRATGKVMGLKDFKVSPAKIQTGKNRPEVVKAKVLKSRSMKPLKMGKLKAFVTKFSSGHVAVVQRRGEERTPIKTFSTNSIPVMLKNERRVYGVVKPHIMQNLKQNVEIQVRKILEG
ncbi:MAG: hypothetical protein HFH64_03920 [Lachnospiraceae bacterium]|nr:hypothetical protein [Lachnospiraceae bacterium]